MRLPFQIKIPRSRRTTYKFNGLDKRSGAAESYFSDMLNMSGVDNECIASRKKRGSLGLNTSEIYSMVTTDVLINGVIRENAFIVDAGSRLRAFYYENGKLKSSDIMNTVGFTTGKNKMIASGGYLYFFPDKKYINLMNLRDLGSLEAHIDKELGAVGDRYYELLFDSTDEYGKELQEKSGYVRIRCDKFKCSDSAKGEFMANDIFAFVFNKGDVITINASTAFDGTYKIAHIPDNNSYIVVKGYIDEDLVVSSGNMSLSRTVPDMDYVVSAGNRLWGCKYGVNENGEPINEIYASRLGDAKNWNSFDGVSTDSYVASIGVDGVFTGAVVYEDDPHFFKEDAVIRIYGTTPSNFTVVTRNIRGIEKGSAESAVIVDDTLYYKTYSGLVAYNGGMPYNIDEVLGDEIYKKAVAGSCDGKYYVSMQNSSGEYELFVYNTLNGLWYKEDDLRVRCFCRCGNELYMLTGDTGENSIISAMGSGNGEAEQTVNWSAETSDLDYLIPQRKYISRIVIKCEMDSDAYMRLDIAYNGENKWYKAGDRSGINGVASFAVCPRRCDSFRLRLSGRGSVKIISVLRIESMCGDYR